MMKRICCHPKTPPLSATAPSSIATCCESTLGKIIDSAELLITKWNPDSSRATSLFYESRTEALEFVKCVTGLHKAMHLLVSDSGASEKLVRALGLMRIAMKRLRKEFYHILTTNRAQLDPESISTRSSRCNSDESVAEVEESSSSTAVADLRSIADCMIASGCAAECTDIYIMIRKSVIDEGVFRLGVERLSAALVNKMDWEVLEFRIKIWLEAVKIAMTTQFAGERILCDHVFAASDAVRESCFGAVSRDGAAVLFGFPEIVATGKKSAEKLFKSLDMYAAMSENLPEIDSIFAFDSTLVVRSQARNSISRLGESVHAILTIFETAIQKDSSKTAVAGAGVHPLTVYAMNYLSTLADYSQIVADIFGKLPPPPSRSSFPESSDDASAVSLRTARLILVLLCKLDGKANQYRDMSVSYLFLLNNLHYVVHKVLTSDLRHLLGEEWTVTQGNKVRQFAVSYERLGWTKVFESLPEDPEVVMTPAEAKDYFVKFNSSFEEASQRHRLNIVHDPRVGDEIRVSIERKLLVRGYRLFYDTHRLTAGGERNAALFVKYTPEDIGIYLSDMFLTSGGQGANTNSPSSSSSHRFRVFNGHCR